MATDYRYQLVSLDISIPRLLNTRHNVFQYDIKSRDLNPTNLSALDRTMRSLTCYVRTFACQLLVYFHQVLLPYWNTLSSEHNAQPLHSPVACFTVCNNALQYGVISLPVKAIVWLLSDSVPAIFPWLAALSRFYLLILTILKHTLGIEPNGSYYNPAPAEQWPLSLNVLQYGVL